MTLSLNKVKSVKSLNKVKGKVKVKIIKRASADDDDKRAWPEEEEAMTNIREGRVETEVQSADELIAELKELENEP